MKECPMIQKSCIKENCIGYCTTLKRKIYTPEVKLKRCPNCGMHLIPYDEIYLHPKNENCRYYMMLPVQIPTEKEYMEAIGTPKSEENFNDLITQLTTKPKSLWDKLLTKIKNVTRKSS